jgi:hypothetical protein
MWGHYGSNIMGVFLGPLSEVLGSITVILWWYRFLSMEDCAPSTFLGSWALVALYLCFKFRIFYRTFLEEYVSHVKGGPTFASIMPTCNTRWLSSCS